MDNRIKANANKIDLLEKELAELRSLTKDHERRIKYLEDSSFNELCERTVAVMGRLGDMELKGKLIWLRKTTMDLREAGLSWKAITEELWTKIEKLTADN